MKSCLIGLPLQPMAAKNGIIFSRYCYAPVYARLLVMDEGIVVVKTSFLQNKILPRQIINNLLPRGSVVSCSQFTDSYNRSKWFINFFVLLLLLK